jgi:dysferlin
VEVSIGNYGNTHETDVAPGSSVTVATAAVSDGSNYWYISWEDKKPILELQCEFEDIEFRMQTLNLLRTLARSLDAALAQLGQFLRDPATGDAAMVHRLVHDAVLAFARECRAALPELPSTAFTKLDFHLRELREAKKLALSETARTVLAGMQVGWFVCLIGCFGGDFILYYAAALQTADCLNDDLHAAVSDLQARMRELSFEPQLSVPDVIFWVLTNGKRRAFCRVPADQLVYHENPAMRGQKFGAVQSLFLNIPQASKIKSSEVGGFGLQDRLLLIIYFFWRPRLATSLRSCSFGPFSATPRRKRRGRRRLRAKRCSSPKRT